MSDNQRNMFAVALIVVACMVFFILLAGVVYLANGIDGLQTFLTVSGYLGALIVIVLLVSGIQIVGAWIGNLHSRNFIAAQQSNDNSDVAKFGVLKEALRGDREYERDVRRAALREPSTVTMVPQIEQTNRRQALPMYNEKDNSVYTTWE